MDVGETLLDTQKLADTQAQLESMIEQSPHESEIPREFLSPWASVVNAASQQSLHPELQLELAPEHVLYGLPVRLIALHNTDDVLFEILDGSGRLAVVHLT